jgi:hypothetical protein
MRCVKKKVHGNIAIHKQTQKKQEEDQVEENPENGERGCVTQQTALVRPEPYSAWLLLQPMSEKDADAKIRDLIAGSSTTFRFVYVTSNSNFDLNISPTSKLSLPFLTR